jgi:hypothetical protein
MSAMARSSAVGLLGSMLLAACGGGGGGAGTCESVSGTWTSAEVVDGSACGEGTTTQQNSYAVTQSACDITVASNGATFSGSVSGTHLSWRGSFPQGGGTTAITSMDLVLSSDQTTATGKVSWTWSGGGQSCSGTTQITATRAGPSSAQVKAATDALSAKLIQCGLGSQAQTDSLAAAILQGVVPDPTYFGACIQALDCSQLMSAPAIQGCVNLDDAATVCSGASLHACAKTGPCIDVTCSTACGYVGYSFDHCGFDPSKGHDVCYCR